MLHNTAILNRVKARIMAQTVPEKDSLRNFLVVFYKGESGETAMMVIWFDTWFSLINLRVICTS